MYPCLGEKKKGEILGRRILAYRRGYHGYGPFPFSWQPWILIDVRAAESLGKAGTELWNCTVEAYAKRMWVQWTASRLTCGRGVNHEPWFNQGVKHVTSSRLSAKVLALGALQLPAGGGRPAQAQWHTIQIGSRGAIAGAPSLIFSLLQHAGLSGRFVSLQLEVHQTSPYSCTCAFEVPAPGLQTHCELLGGGWSLLEWRVSCRSRCLRAPLKGLPSEVALWNGGMAMTRWYFLEMSCKTVCKTKFNQTFTT